MGNCPTSNFLTPVRSPKLEFLLPHDSVATELVGEVSGRFQVRALALPDGQRIAGWALRGRIYLSVRSASLELVFEGPLPRKLVTG